MKKHQHQMCPAQRTLQTASLFDTETQPGNSFSPTQDDQMQRLSRYAGITLNSLREMSGDAHVIRLPQKLPLEQVVQIANRLADVPEAAQAQEQPYSMLFSSSAALRVIPGTAASSSTVAFRIPSSDPKRFSSNCRRFGPMPGISSSRDDVADLLRSLRW